MGSTYLLSCKIMQARKDIPAFVKMAASVAAMIAAMTSCVRETFEMTMPEEGRKVTVTLPLASPGVMETVVTKANTYSNMASIILFIYNADGTVCEKILETENGDITLEGGSEYSDDANSGRLYTARLECMYLALIAANNIFFIMPVIVLYSAGFYNKSRVRTHSPNVI